MVEEASASNTERRFTASSTPGTCSAFSGGSPSGTDVACIKSSQEAVSFSWGCNAEEDLSAELVVETLEIGKYKGEIHQCVQPRWYTRPELPRQVHRGFAELKYELDWYQDRARRCLELGESVFIAAPTSAGKTTVALDAISLCFAEQKRCVYTTPIKALSNQKYGEFATQFGANEVCLMTGDNTLGSPATALLVVMTTEILRSVLYGGHLREDDEFLSSVKTAVFDEVHYLGDQDRGVAWEETIVLLERHVNLVCLSATIPNALDMAGWLAQIRQAPCHVITRMHRPVPLEHHLYICPKNESFLVVDSRGWFDEKKFAQANSKLAKGDAENPNVGNQRERELKKFLRNCSHERGMPLIVFCFSRQQCLQFARAIAGEVKLSSFESDRVRTQVREVLDKLVDPEDRSLEIIREVTEFFLPRGIGVHHGGLLPFLRELTEALFQESLVKVLFATETFGMGVNMPSRGVCFNWSPGKEFQKFDGKGMRRLLAGEYIQMSGRAGRRGKDKRGKVSNMISYQVDKTDVQELGTGKSEPVKSQFQLRDNMLLDCLVWGRGLLELMLMQSFLQFQTGTIEPLLREDSEKRLAFLQTLGLLSEEYTLTRLGEAARHIRAADDELLTATWMFQGGFHEADPDDLVAFLSCLVNDEEAGEEVPLPESEKGLQRLQEGCEKQIWQLKSLGEPWSLRRNADSWCTILRKRCGLCEAILVWQRGKPFKQVVAAATGSTEGLIVRVIRRTHTLLRGLEKSLIALGAEEQRCEWTELLEKIQVGKTRLRRGDKALPFLESIHFVEAHYPGTLEEPDPPQMRDSPCPHEPEQEVYLKPSEIGFSHGSVSFFFRNNRGNIAETLQELLDGTKKPEDFPEKMYVYWCGGRYYTLGNRRLTVMRLLEQMDPSKGSRIPVWVASAERARRWGWDRKFTTGLWRGRSVRIRETGEMVGLTACNTNFLWGKKLRPEGQPCSAPQNEQRSSDGGPSDAADADHATTGRLTGYARCDKPEPPVNDGQDPRLEETTEDPSDPEETVITSEEPLLFQEVAIAIDPYCLTKYVLTRSLTPNTNRYAGKPASQWDLRLRFDDGAPQEIPERHENIQSYCNSFALPLLDETRNELVKAIAAQNLDLSLDSDTVVDVTLADPKTIPQDEGLKIPTVAAVPADLDSLQKFALKLPERIPEAARQRLAPYQLVLLFLPGVIKSPLENPHRPNASVENTGSETKQACAETVTTDADGGYCFGLLFVGKAKYPAVMLMPMMETQERNTDASREAMKMDFTPGARVQCHGLKTVMYNDMQGVIEQFDDEIGRWQVKLDSGECKSFKPENLKDSPGTYFAADKLEVRQTESRKSRLVSTLPKGTSIEVLEVANGLDEERVRARIANGWVSLRHTGSGQRFATKDRPTLATGAWAAYRPIRDQTHQANVLGELVSCGGGDHSILTADRPRTLRMALLDCNVCTSFRIAEALSTPDAHMPVFWQEQISGMVDGESAVFSRISADDCQAMQGNNADERMLLNDSRTQALNKSQREAVVSALTLKHGVRLIQGPPGTGKTEMLAALLELALKLRHRSLVCAPTNIALREICERLLKRRERAIGLGTTTLATADAANPCSATATSPVDHQWSFAQVALIASHERAEVEWDDCRSAVFLDHRKKRIKRVARWHLGEGVGSAAKPFLEQPPWAETGQGALLTLLCDPKRAYLRWHHRATSTPPQPKSLAFAWSWAEGRLPKSIGEFLRSALASVLDVMRYQLKQLHMDLASDSSKIFPSRHQLTKREKKDWNTMLHIHKQMLILRQHLQGLHDALERLTQGLERSHEIFDAAAQRLLGADTTLVRHGKQSRCVDETKNPSRAPPPCEPSVSNRRDTRDFKAACRGIDSACRGDFSELLGLLQLTEVAKEKKRMDGLCVCPRGPCDSNCPQKKTLDKAKRNLQRYVHPDKIPDMKMVATEMFKKIDTIWDGLASEACGDDSRDNMTTGQPERPDPEASGQHDSSQPSTWSPVFEAAFPPEGSDKDGSEVLQTLRMALNRFLETAASVRVAQSTLQRAVLLRHCVLIFSTINVGGRALVKDQEIPTVLIDEAAQSHEAANLVVLRSDVERLLLVGDPRQLPAVVSSDLANRCQFQRSLFERLTAIGHEPSLLNLQYRMHEDILAFSNEAFYEGKVLTDESVKGRDPKAMFNMDNLEDPRWRFRLGTLRIFDTSRFKFIEDEREGHSCLNTQEADCVLRTLEYFKRHCQPSDDLVIGIVTPYNAQVRYLNRMLEEKGGEREWLRDHCRVRSVESFQGNECDIIVFSAVRSVEKPSAATARFLNDARRMNVAITRGKLRVWIFGDLRTLEKNGEVSVEFDPNLGHHGMILRGVEVHSVSEQAFNKGVEAGWVISEIDDQAVRTGVQAQEALECAVKKQQKFKVTFWLKVWRRLGRFARDRNWVVDAKLDELAMRGGHIPRVVPRAASANVVKLIEQDMSGKPVWMLNYEYWCSEVQKDGPWIEARNNNDLPEPYCTLCDAWATAEHLESPAHRSSCPRPFVWEMKIHRKAGLGFLTQTVDMGGNRPSVMAISDITKGGQLDIINERAPFDGKVPVGAYIREVNGQQSFEAMQAVLESCCPVVELVCSTEPASPPLDCPPMLEDTNLPSRRPNVAPQVLPTAPISPVQVVASSAQSSNSLPTAGFHHQETSPAATQQSSISFPHALEPGGPGARWRGFVPVVRKGRELDSEILDIVSEEDKNNVVVEQSAAWILVDTIVRMPISFLEGGSKSTSFKREPGWVTVWAQNKDTAKARQLLRLDVGGENHPNPDHPKQDINYALEPGGPGARWRGFVPYVRKGRELDSEIVDTVRDEDRNHVVVEQSAAWILVDSVVRMPISLLESGSKSTSFKEPGWVTVWAQDKNTAKVRQMLKLDDGRESHPNPDQPTSSASSSSSPDASASWRKRRAATREQANPMAASPGSSSAKASSVEATSAPLWAKAPAEFPFAAPSAPRPPAPPPPPKAPTSFSPTPSTSSSSYAHGTPINWGAAIDWDTPWSQVCWRDQPGAEGKFSCRGCWRSWGGEGGEWQFYQHLMGSQGKERHPNKANILRYAQEFEEWKRSGR